MKRCAIVGSTVVVSVIMVVVVVVIVVEVDGLTLVEPVNDGNEVDDNDDEGDDAPGARAFRDLKANLGLGTNLVRWMLRVSDMALIAYKTFIRWGDPIITQNRIRIDGGEAIG